MTEAVIVRSVTRVLCRTVAKAASVSGYISRLLGAAIGSLRRRSDPIAGFR